MRLNKLSLKYQIEHILTPSIQITGFEERQRVRLLLALLFAGIIGFPITAITRQASSQIWYAVLLIPIYILARTVYYRFAIRIGILVLLFPPFISATANAGTYTSHQLFLALAWLMIPITVTGLLAPVNSMVVALLGINGFILLLPVLVNIPFSHIIAPFAFNMTISTLVLIGSVIREKYARIIDGHVKELEFRVQQRTSDLEKSNQALQQEIQQHQQTQSQLKQAHDETLQALALKTNIIANVNHDVRTPLNIIILQAQKGKRAVALNDVAAPVFNNVFDSVLANSNELLSLFDNLLQLSQAGQDSMDPVNEQFRLTDLLDAVYKSVCAPSTRKNLSIQMKIDPGVPEYLYGDAGRLKQILNNLVTNAVSFSADGQILVHAYRADLAHWEIRVSDTGIGIPAKDLEGIFEPFWQADSSVTRRVNRGVGLGLTVVKQLVESMSGRISVSSEVGVGSTFTITFPLRNGK